MKPFCRVINPVGWAVARGSHMDPIMDVVSIFSLIKVCCFELCMAQLTNPVIKNPVKGSHFSFIHPDKETSLLCFHRKDWKL